MLSIIYSETDILDIVVTNAFQYTFHAWEMGILPVPPIGPLPSRPYATIYPASL